MTYLNYSLPELQREVARLSRLLSCATNCTVATTVDLPTVGKTGVLYITTDPDDIYLWDADIGDYVNVVTAPLVAKKTSDETVQSTTTFALDSELKVDVAATTTYTFEAVILYNADSNVDIKFRFNNLTDVDLSYNISTDSSSDTLKTRTSSTISTNSSGVDKCVIFTGVLTTVTAGVFGLEWAPWSSAAFDCSVLKGSWLRLTEI